MNDKVFVDTNILLYARDSGQPAKQLIATPGCHKICKGCHKADGAGLADADYPQLAGQHASVIICMTRAPLVRLPVA